MGDRYEVLPFRAAEDEAAVVERPLTLTVTCSPRHGVDHALDAGVRLRRLGHDVVVHVAARALGGPEHLDRVLRRLETHGIEDVLLIAGDAHVTAGPYGSALELLPIVDAHPRRPRRIGVGGYPEGHPLIDAPTLEDTLRVKARVADYLVTQICFDPEVLLDWIASTRDSGVDLPVYVGIPGAVDRRRLLEVSMRVGVGASLGFLRRQRGVHRLLARPRDAAGPLLDAVSPLIGDPGWGIAGQHFFTFNRLGATLARQAARAARPAKEVRDA